VTVELTHSEVSYDGNNVTTAFPTTFRFLENDHLDVDLSTDGGTTWTALVEGTDYEVSGAADPEPGGTVTLTGHGALLSGEKLRIQRNTDDVQPTTFGAFTSFSASSHERELDRRTLRSQELERRIAALEALGDLVSVSEIADAVAVDEELSPSGSVTEIEDFFPFTVVVPNGENARAACLYVLDDDQLSPVPAPVIAWKPGPAANRITILRIDGLSVSGSETQPYHLKGLVFF
jgi:hypothetical protein